MQTIGASLADPARTEPAKDAARDREVYRLIDLHASTEAAAALATAAERAQHDAGIVKTVLATASAVLGGDASDAARDALRDAVTTPEFILQLPEWVRELREIASVRPETGACTIGSALELWAWSLNYFRRGDGSKHEGAAVAIDELAAILSPLLAARSLVFEAAALAVPPSATDIDWRSDLAHVQAARTASAAGAACAELVFGYRTHLVWDAKGCDSCYSGEEADGLDALIPGIASGARMTASVVEADGSHAPKRGPCAGFAGVDTFMRLRNRLDGCLTGARIAKDRAVSTLTRSMAASNPEGTA